jgi:uncharacterized protein (TIGR02147 family)
LKAYFAEQKANGSGFSHRSLCRRLGLTSPNFILMVIQGKRNLTRSLAFRISREAGHDEKETEYFASMVDFARAKTTMEKDRCFKILMALRKALDIEKIEEHQYEYYTNWYNLVIRELVTYPDFKGNFNWLARKVRPQITPGQAKRSVELLLKLGLIKKNGKSFVRTSALISTGPQVSYLAVANFHRTMAQQAATAVDTIPKDERDMSSCTINISQKGFEQVKEAILECEKKIMAIAGTDTPADRVYQMNLHLFPVSAKDRKKLSGSNV